MSTRDKLTMADDKKRQECLKRRKKRRKEKKDKAKDKP